MKIINILLLCCLFSLASPAATVSVITPTRTSLTNATLPQATGGYQLGATAIGVSGMTNLTLPGYITLGNTTNRISDDGTNVTRNGTAIGTGGSALWTNIAGILSPYPTVAEVDIVNDASAGDPSDAILHVAAIDNVAIPLMYADFDFSGSSLNGQGIFTLSGNNGALWSAFQVITDPLTGVDLSLFDNAVIVTQFQPMTASGAAYTFNTKQSLTNLDSILLAQNAGSNRFRIDANSGYSGAGTLFLSDDGTYKTAGGAANWTASGTTNSLLAGTASVDGLVSTNNVTVMGRLRVADGSGALPSIVFTSDDDASGTGFSRLAANTIGVSINGGEQVRFDSGGLLIGALVRMSAEASAVLQLGSDSATPVAQLVKSPDAIGANIAGVNLSLGGGRSTGTGVGGSILLQTSPAGGAGSSQNALVTALTIPASGAISGRLPVDYGFACSDETSALTTTTNAVRIQLPHAMTLTGVFASVTTPQSSGSIITVDLKEGGTSMLSTLVTIDNNETGSNTAATPAVISDTAIAQYGILVVSTTQVGTGGAGLKFWISGYR